jgi:type II secretory pathway pseudopilin PulG
MGYEMFGSNTQNIKSKMAGFSLPGVLVGVGLIGISATIVSQTVINSRRAQKSAELKLTSNKFQQAALDAVTERVREFVFEKCSGARWGGGGLDVEKAFREFPLAMDSNVRTSLRFTTSADLLDGHPDVKDRCKEPVGPTASEPTKPIRFCMEITKTGSDQVDYRLLELLIVPINLASDQPIQCSQASGAAAGVKVTWQMYNQIDNKKISGSASVRSDANQSSQTVMKESGVFLISLEAESYSGTCSITASRNGSTNQCEVNVSGLGRRPPKLFRNSAPVADVNWERVPSANYDAFKTTTSCDTAIDTVFEGQASTGTDFCKETVLALPVTCKLRPVQGDLEYWTAKVERRPELMVKVTSDHTNLNFPVVVSSGSDPVPAATWSLQTKPEIGCSDPPCYRARFLNHDVWMPGIFKVEFREGSVVRGSCSAYNFSCWDTTWRTGRMAYWQGGGLVRSLAAARGVAVSPEAYNTGSVFNHDATKNKLCEWVGMKVMFSSTTSSENRNNYTIPQDNTHMIWNGSSITTVPATGRNWVGCLLCN